MISVLLVVALGLITVMFVKRVVAHVRRHHPVANRRFMGRYRAEGSRSSRTTGHTAESVSMSPARRPEQSDVIELSHQWAEERLHWHGFTTPDAPPIVLWSPSAVASWAATATGHTELRHPILVTAANGEPVSVDGVIIESATTDCTYRCGSR